MLQHRRVEPSARLTRQRALTATDDDQGSEQTVFIDEIRGDHPAGEVGCRNGCDEFSGCRRSTCAWIAQRERNEL
jgi:hypothetical protein